MKFYFILFVFYIFFGIHAFCQSNISEFSFVNVLEYGVTKDNSKDDDSIIISKLCSILSKHGGGTLYFPSGTYHLKSPIWLQSNVTILGQDMINTKFINVSNNYTNGFVFASGWFHERDHDFVQNFFLKPIKSGDNFIVLSNDFIDRFKVGDLIVIRQGALPKSLDNDHQTSPYAELNKVVDIDYSKNTLILNDPIDFDLLNDFPLKSLTVSKLEGGEFGGYKTYIVENVSIFNVSVESTFGNWMSRDAVYNGCFKDIFVNKSYTLLGGNGKKFCIFENISGFFTSRFIENAEGSSNNKMSNINGNLLIDSSRKNRLYPLIVLSYGDSLVNFTIYNNTKQFVSSVIRTRGNSYISSGTVKTHLKGPIIILSDQNNIINNVSFDFFSDNVSIFIKSVKNNFVFNSIISNNSFSGSFDKFIFDPNLKFENVKFKNNSIVNFINKKIKFPFGKDSVNYYNNKIYFKN